MKPEPLRNKICGTYNNDGYILKIYLENDIKSAVEWLKNEIEQITAKSTKRYIHNKIDEAFEDVCFKQNSEG